MTKRQTPTAVLAAALSAALLVAGLLPSPATAQGGVSGISPKAFGSRSWRENGMEPGDLPATGNRAWDVRLAADLHLYAWTGLAWVDITTADSGDAPTVSVTAGTTATLPAGEPATVTSVGSPTAMVLNFAIPAGQDGAVGPEGPVGPQGPAGSISLTGVDNHLLRMDGAASVQDSQVIVEDDGSLRVPLSGAYTQPVLRIGTASQNGFAQESAGGPLRVWIDGTEALRQHAGGTVFLGGPWATAPSAQTCDTDGANTCFSPNASTTATGVSLVTGGIGLMSGGSNVVTATRTGSQNIATLHGAMRAVPQSFPPVTCGSANTEGVIYSDVSHALCYCSGAGAWINLTPSEGGTCS